MAGCHVLEFMPALSDWPMCSRPPETFHVPVTGMLRKSFLEGLPEIKLEKRHSLCKNRLLHAVSSVRDVPVLLTGGRRDWPV